MDFESIVELYLYPVEDRGKPNYERIPIYVRETVDMGQFGVLIGQSDVPGRGVPVKDQFYWFGNGTLNAGDWVLLYTGNGEARIDSVQTQSNSKIYSVHWGKKATIFANSKIVPILFRLGGVEVGDIPSDLPQQALSSAE